RVRRDIESGHSQAIEAVAGRGTSRATGRAHPESRAKPGPRSRSRLSLAAAVLAGVTAVIGAASYAVWRRSPPRPAPDATRMAALSDGAIQSRVALASSSLDARNYRAALAYALEVLAADSRQ